MDRSVYRVTLCLLGLGLLQSNAFEVDIKDGSNKTCIYANMMVNFTVHYETSKSTYENVTIPASSTVTTNGSTCGGSGISPLLKVNFGNYTWSLSFTRNDTLYSGDVITFTYNTNDTNLFPDALRKGILNSTTSSYHDPIPLNATFKCLHPEVVVTGNVTQLYWDVTLLAYAENVTQHIDVHCSADNPTTQPPTSHLVTTPNTTSTTPTPTTKPVDKPAIGNYSVSNGSGTCLLASLGLQLNVSLQESKNIWTLIDINPNTTIGSGSCGNDTAILRLNDSNRAVVELYFSIKKKSFYLQEINVTLTTVSGSVQRSKQNLSLWEASVGNSYLCHKEQLINVSEDLYMNTFDVRVQPFSVKNATYAIATECSIDDDSILIPIVVGAALAGLIVIVVIAYLIGRRKSYAGYQTL